MMPLSDMAILRLPPLESGEAKTCLTYLDKLSIWRLRFGYIILRLARRAHEPKLTVYQIVSRGRGWSRDD